MQAGATVCGAAAFSVAASDRGEGAKRWIEKFFFANLRHAAGGPGHVSREGTSERDAQGSAPQDPSARVAPARWLGLAWPHDAHGRVSP